ncbi:hypothetical protein HYY75_07105 [bacterium]|nr:hypothetical protein [bacterium]
MTNGKQIRMATPELPDKQGHTIVGGRPMGEVNKGKGIPRGMELLLKRAAVDELFRSELFEKRSKVADDLGIPLDQSERMMLDQIPGNQLSAIIGATKVPDSQKRTLIGASTAAMLALLAQLTFVPSIGQAQPAEGANRISSQQKPAGERPGDFLRVQVDTGARPDYLMPPGGCREDFPDEPDIISPTPSDEQQTPSIEKLKSITVAIDVSGRTFSEALRLLEKESGINISYGSFGADVSSKVVSKHTNGVSLYEALNDIAKEATPPEFHFDLSFNGNKAILRFSPKKDSIVPISPPKPDIGITRGSRPDEPPFSTSTGIRPDLPQKNPDSDEESK